MAINVSKELGITNVKYNGQQNKRAHLVQELNIINLGDLITYPIKEHHESGAGAPLTNKFLGRKAA